MGYSNPWNNLKNEDYERHMGHINVDQLSVLSKITAEQLELVQKLKKPIVAILGVANGNGLEHIETGKYKAVIGIDISSEFLTVCRNRYSNLLPILQLHQIDLITQKQQAIEVLRHADLIIANLLIEHIHLDNFIEIIKEPRRAVVSVTIQVNPDGVLVSYSGFEDVFSEIVKFAQECGEKKMISSMKEIGYGIIGRSEYVLPNNKLFVRIDFGRA
jgi:uncharacterized Rossmann fold enzyme